MYVCVNICAKIYVCIPACMYELHALISALVCNWQQLRTTVFVCVGVLLLFCGGVNALQFGAVQCNVLLCVAIRSVHCVQCSVLQCFAMCCNLLLCGAVYCFYVSNSCAGVFFVHACVVGIFFLGCGDMLTYTCDAHTFRYMQIYAYMHVCIYAFACMCAYMYVYLDICFTCIYVCVYIYICLSHI